MGSISQDYPYYSRKMSVYSGNGMVASSHMLATQTGLQILREGGNAMDAAVAAAAALLWLSQQKTASAVMHLHSFGQTVRCMD
nr:gamma-glutamyltransferase [Alicyclobacillus mengziensis]